MMVDIPASKFVKYIKNRVSNKSSKNFLSLCTGATGSGKSYHMLALAEMLDPEFSVDRVAFTAKELMEIINSGKLKKGSVIIADEFGTAHFSRNFQQSGNIMINFLLQSFRKFGYIFLASTPSLSFIDKASRILFHCHFVMQSIDFKQRVSYSKPYFLQLSHFENKAYKKFLRVLMPELNRYVALEELTMPMPSKELREQYENKKDEFLRELNKKIAKAVARQEEKDAGLKQLTGKQQEVHELCKEGLDVKEIADKLKVSLNTVYTHLSYIKKKGYDDMVEYGGK